MSENEAFWATVGCSTAFCGQMLSPNHLLGIQSSRYTSELISQIFFASWQLSFGRYNAPKFERFRWLEILSLVNKYSWLRRALNIKNKFSWKMSKLTILLDWGILWSNIFELESDGSRKLLPKAQTEKSKTQLKFH